jgi:hypothetical protein
MLKEKAFFMILKVFLSKSDFEAEMEILRFVLNVIPRILAISNTFSSE